jgi:hypothetical protein
MNCKRNVLDKLFGSPKDKDDLLCDCFCGWLQVSDDATCEVEGKLVVLALARADRGKSFVAFRPPELCPEVLLKACFFYWRDVKYWRDVLEEEALAEMVRVDEVRLLDLVEGDESEKVEQEVVEEEGDFVVVEEMETEAAEAWVEEWPDTDDGFLNL